MPGTEQTANIDVVPFYGAVAADLSALLATAALSEDFDRVLRRALALDGKALSDAPRSWWPLLALLPAWAAGKDWHGAVPVATAAELVGLSTDVFDEIEDGDDCPLARELGGPRATNLAFGLLALALSSLDRVPAAVGRPLRHALLVAADGQHQDLGGARPVSLAEYEALVGRKSAALVAACCTSGSLAAGLPQSAINAWTEFGRCIGRMSQARNDLRDLSDGRKSDLDRRLATLPVVFALGAPEDGTRRLVEGYLSGTGPLTPSELGELREALAASGALHFVWLVAETERQEALRALAAASPDRAAAVSASLLAPTPFEGLLTSSFGWLVWAGEGEPCSRTAQDQLPAPGARGERRAIGVKGA